MNETEDRAFRALLINLGDTQLLELLDVTSQKLSFYNAAEGDWERERKLRERAHYEFHTVRGECIGRGLEYHLKEYPLL